MSHAPNDPADLIRNGDHEEAAALVPFLFASQEDEENLNPLPPCAWICFALPGNVQDRNLPGGDVERCTPVSTLRYLMEGAFQFSEDTRNLPVFGNAISLETVMRSLHKCL